MNIKVGDAERPVQTWAGYLEKSMKRTGVGHAAADIARDAAADRRTWAAMLDLF
jgi:hypothetical protein